MLVFVSVAAPPPAGACQAAGRGGVHPAPPHHPQRLPHLPLLPTRLLVRPGPGWGPSSWVPVVCCKRPASACVRANSCCRWETATGSTSPAAPLRSYLILRIAVKQLTTGGAGAWQGSRQGARAGGQGCCSRHLHVARPPSMAATTATTTPSPACVAPACARPVQPLLLTRHIAHTHPTLTTSTPPPPPLPPSRRHPRDPRPADHPQEAASRGAAWPRHVGRQHALPRVKPHTAGTCACPAPRGLDRWDGCRPTSAQPTGEIERLSRGGAHLPSARYYDVR